ncbi:MAG: hypothetical protein ACLQKH_04150 [Steroidobacteraceae bacterium]
MLLSLYSQLYRPLGNQPRMFRPNAILIFLILVCQPASADDTIEARRPLPLLQMMADHQKQMMRDHLAAVQEIVTALSSDDFDAVQHAAVRLGYSDEVGRVCIHMGAASPAFTRQALAFHHTADGIVAAARERNRGRVLAELSTTLQACRACHAQWKQEIVDEPTWNRLIAAPQATDHTDQ